MFPGALGRDESRANALPDGPGSNASSAFHAQSVIHDVLAKKLFLLAALRTRVGRDA